MKRKSLRERRKEKRVKKIRKEVRSKLLAVLLKILGTVLKVGLIGFVLTFTLYITNGENKLIYYVVRPFLNKHYDSQVRDRRIV